MATVRVTGVRHARASRVPVALLRGAVTGARPLSLRSALAQVGELRQALLLSQQERVTAQEQVAILSSANARLKRLALQRELIENAGRGCSDAMEDLPLAKDLEPEELSLLQRLLAKRVRFPRGAALYRLGGGFAALYVIRSGSCKTVLLGRGGEQQVVGYHIVGDVVGLDGIGSSVHGCEAIALEDTEACRLSFDRIENFARLSDRFRLNLHRLLSREYSRAQMQSLVLGTMCADRRLAVFLLDLSACYAARGLSSCEFALRMTRAEIGSYLGLKLETVSRAFSRFHEQGLLQVQGRLVKLLDRGSLARIAEGD